MAATSTKKSAATAAAQPKAARTTIKTKIVVVDDTGRGSDPRQRTYEVRNADTGEVLGFVGEVWQGGSMDYKKSVEEKRRALVAFDANKKEIGTGYASRARTVAAVRANASA